MAARFTALIFVKEIYNGMMPDKAFFIKALILSFLVVSTTMLLNIQHAAAFSVSDYFTLSYQITLSTSEVNVGEPFNAIASGTGTLKAALPISVSSAVIEGRVIATNQATGAEVTLNSGYTVTIKPFPNKVGQTLQLTQTIPLVFPAGSPAGIYTITGELTEAKVDAIIWLDVTSYLPPSESVGTVNYALNSSGSTGISNVSGSAPGISTTPAPVAGPSSALFQTDSLVINPTTVKSGEKVNITSQITNIGDVTGTDAIVLKINNQVEATQDVTLTGGENNTVTFTTSGNLPGNYAVDVAGLNGNFTVTTSTITPWFWLVVMGVIVLAGVMLGWLIILLRRKKAGSSPNQTTMR